jgi:hypothetical protein
MADKRTPTAPLPTIHEDIREEMKYWWEQFSTAPSGSAWETQVRTRLEALYALERPPAEKSLAAALLSEGRVRLLVGGCCMPWSGSGAPLRHC